MCSSGSHLLIFCRTFKHSADFQPSRAFAAAAAEFVFARTVDFDPARQPLRDRLDWRRNTSTNRRNHLRFSYRRDPLLKSPDRFQCDLCFLCSFAGTCPATGAIETPCYSCRMKRPAKSKQHQNAARSRALKLTPKRRSQIAGQGGTKAARIQRAMRAMASVADAWERGEASEDQLRAAIGELRAAGWVEK